MVPSMSKQRNIGSKYEKVKERLLAVKLLSLLKKRFSYRELSRLTGLSESILCRYITGKRIPDTEQAKRILSSIISKLNLMDIILEKIRGMKGYIDLQTISVDSLILQLATIHAYMRYRDKGVTKIIVPETRGIPLATLIALELNSDLVIARRTRENPFEEYIHGVVVESPFNMISFYVPRRSLDQRDRVLIVDDLIQTGKTIQALSTIVRKSRAKLIGVLVLLALGDSWKQINVNEIDVLVKITDPSKLMPV